MIERAFRADAREAKGLHDESITAIVRPCKQELWALLEEIERVNGRPAWQCMDFDVRCPFDVDRLWVQEAFWCDNDQDGGGEYGPVLDCGSMLTLGKDYGDIDYCAAPRCMQDVKVKGQQTVDPWKDEPVPGDWWLSPPDDWNGEDDEDHERRGEWVFLPHPFFTKHSRTQMPRWASRTVLTVSDVTPIRLHSIALELFAALGIGFHGLPYVPGTKKEIANAIAEFEKVWNTTPRAAGDMYHENPWVWHAKVAKVDDSARVGADSPAGTQASANGQT